MGSLFCVEETMEKIKIGIAENINSRNYWESRFSTGDWEHKGGRFQTASFAATQVRHFRFPREFSGLIVDFGCGLGDAMPTYNKFFPRATLIGLDVSKSAIEKCQLRYGNIARFILGTHQDVPGADVIVASNIFEHLSDDIQIARTLLNKCGELYIIVPYKENPLCSEHVRAYHENYFRDLGDYEYTIFLSRGWSEYGRNLLRLKLGNFYRRLFGGTVRSRRTQIMFYFQGTLPKLRN